MRQQTGTLDWYPHGPAMLNTRVLGATRSWTAFGSGVKKNNTTTRGPQPQAVSES